MKAISGSVSARSSIRRLAFERTRLTSIYAHPDGSKNSRPVHGFFRLFQYLLSWIVVATWTPPDARPRCPAGAAKRPSGPRTTGAGSSAQGPATSSQRPATPSRRAVAGGSGLPIWYPLPPRNVMKKRPPGRRPEKSKKQGDRRHSGRSPGPQPPHLAGRAACSPEPSRPRRSVSWWPTATSADRLPLRHRPAGGGFVIRQHGPPRISSGWARAFARRGGTGAVSSRRSGPATARRTMTVGGLPWRPDTPTRDGETSPHPGVPPR